MAESSHDELWRTSGSDMRDLGPVHRHTRQGLLRTVQSLDMSTMLDQMGLPLLLTPISVSGGVAAGWPPRGLMSPASRLVARGLYHLDRLNWPGRGGVLNVLARPARGGSPGSRGRASA